MKYILLLLTIIFSCSKKTDTNETKEQTTRATPKDVTSNAKQAFVLSFDSLEFYLGGHHPKADSLLQQIKDISIIDPNDGLNLLEKTIYAGNSKATQLLATNHFFKKVPFNDKRSIAALTIFLERFNSDYEMEGIYADNPEEEFYKIFQILIENKINLNVNLGKTSQQPNCQSFFIFEILHPSLTKVLEASLTAGIHTDVINIKTMPCHDSPEDKHYTIKKYINKINNKSNASKVISTFNKYKISGF